MPIRQITPQSEINAAIQKAVEKYEKAVIRIMHRIGIECVNQARDIDTYKDRTGNLRSSIGYLIVKDGLILGISGFPVVKDGKQGSSGGKEYALTLTTRFPKGLALIVVAGMDYAGYVEAMNYDVISGQELYARSRVYTLMQQLTSH